MNQRKTSEFERRRFLARIFPPTYRQKERSKDIDENMEPMNMITCLFYDALDNNNFNLAACILAQACLISNIPSRSTQIKKFVGSLQETLVLKEMLIALYRKCGLDQESLSNFFMNTHHSDKRNPMIYLQLLAEWGKLPEVIHLLESGPGHFHKRNRLKKKYEQDLILLQLTQLDGELLSSGILSADDLLQNYEALKPIDFISAWYRGKCLVLFGQLSLAEKVFIDYCEDNPRDPVGFQQLLIFLEHRNEIRKYVRPSYIRDSKSTLQRKWTNETVAQRLLELDPVNSIALETIKKDKERRHEAFCHLWDAIQITDAKQHWDSLLEIMSQEFDDPNFRLFIQNYCTDFLSYMPIHLKIFKQIKDFDEPIIDDNIQLLLEKALLLAIITNTKEQALTSKIKLFLQESRNESSLCFHLSEMAIKWNNHSS
jgi:hypothetical protein